MNIGFYVDSLEESEETNGVYSSLNEAIDSKKVTDASVFYNNIGYNSKDTKFGLFNSTDIWSFSGVLVCLNLNNLNFVSKVVNKIKLVYLYNGEDKNVIGLIDAFKKGVVLAKNKTDADYILRVTGNEVAGTIDNYDVSEILKVCYE